MEVVKPLLIEDLNISGLNEDEKRKLNQVLARNNQIVNHENTRLHRLDKEIRSELSKCADKEKVFPSEKCLVCSKDTDDCSGCEKCRKKVCKKCCILFGTDSIELCKTCYKEMLLEAKAAKWFYTNQEKKQRSKTNIPIASTATTLPSRKSSTKNVADIECVQPIMTTHQQCAVELVDSKKIIDEMTMKMLKMDGIMAKTNTKKTSNTTSKVLDNPGRDAIKAICTVSIDGINKTDEAVRRKQCDDFVAKLIQLNTQMNKACKTK